MTQGILFLLAALAVWALGRRGQPDRDPLADCLVLSAALYPYIYLLARAAFREQSGCSYEVARALGAGPWGLFGRVGLPLARPAIATGVALALMETVADYGTVAHFGVQTLTTGVFSTWLNGNNAGGAAQIAGVQLVDVHAVQEDAALAGFIKPGQNPQEGGLA